jgi:hypothetical protein
MRIISSACICPSCRHAFTAYLADVQNPERDELAPDKRALLCNICERSFVNRLFLAMAEEMCPNGQLPTLLLRLSAMCKEARRAREPGQEAEVGSGSPSGVPGRMQGMLDGDRDTDVSHGVSEHVESPHETLRGPTVLPTELPE